jgi:gliding motility-associatede transport system auxiliary component
MNSLKAKERYFKFLIYVFVIILINIVGLTLFFKIDLTKDNKYSLSTASKEVVSTLSDPLTIKVFFTDNLPAPHNNTERYLHDILEEYSATGKEFFNYTFHNVT